MKKNILCEVTQNQRNNVECFLSSEAPRSKSSNVGPYLELTATTRKVEGEDAMGTAIGR